VTVRAADVAGLVLSVACPYCGAAVGARCMKGRREVSDPRRSHRWRFDALTDPVVRCKNCGRPCPRPKLHGRRLYCNEACRRAYWSTTPPGPKGEP